MTTRWQHGPSRRALLGAALGTPLLVPALQGCADASADPSKLRLGYFANVTHAPALVGTGKGFFAKELNGVRIDTQVFDAGPAAVQALLAGALDIAYLGPNPAITAWVRTKGAGVRLIAGAAWGGAALVVRPGIHSVEDLRGRAVATPQSGGTQDVALRYLLRRHGVRIGGGRDEVEALWMANSQTLDQFRQGRLDAAYLPEPWVSRLVLEAGARVLVDEADLWPGGRFATTCVVVSADYRKRCPRQLREFLAGHVEAIRWAGAHHSEAVDVVNGQIQKLAGKKLKRPVIERAFTHVHQDWDPLVPTIKAVADHTYAEGALSSRPDLDGLADVDPLNAVLRSRGLAPVSGTPSPSQES